MYCSFVWCLSRIANETFEKEEERDPAEFEQPDYDQGKYRCCLIILNLLINAIYFSCMCPMNANRKDLTSFTYYSLCTGGYVYGYTRVLVVMLSCSTHLIHILKQGIFSTQLDA